MIYSFSSLDTSFRKTQMQTTSTKSLENTKRWTVAALSGWAVIVSVAGYYGLFTKFPLPSIALLVVIGIVVPLVIYYRNRSFRDYVSSIHPDSLVVLHLWRILAGFVFLHYGSQHLLPSQFVVNAGYGDLAVGFTVPIVLLLKDSVGKYVGFHIFGLLDFILAVGTGLTFTLLRIPLMETITTFPIVLIPLYGVPISGASSVMAIDALLWRRNAAQYTLVGSR